jgi:molybdopterin converting factor small subunit
LTAVATVHLPSGLRQFTAGVESVRIEAAHAQDLLAELGERFPAMKPALEEMAVAIDGEIYTQPGYQPVRADSDVHLLPRIAGGEGEIGEPGSPYALSY